MRAWKAKFSSRCRACGKEHAAGSKIFNAETGLGWFCSEKCAEAGPLRVSAEDVAARAGAVAFGDNWRARCPAHKSRGLTLSIGQGNDGGVVLRCFAHCETAAVAASLGFEMYNLAPRDSNGSICSSTIRRQAPTPAEIRDALAAEARTYRRNHRIDNAEQFVAADLNGIRRTVSVRLGIALPPIKRRVSDSPAGGHERDELWPLLLDHGWYGVWIAYDGRPPCCTVENFAAHGAVGYQLLEDAELRAVAELRRIVERETRESRSAA